MIQKRPIQFVFVVLFALPHAVTAQWTAARYEWGLQSGIALYQGDLTTQRMGSWPSKKFLLSVNGNRILNASWAVKGQMLFSGLKGNDAYYADPPFRRQRNFSFHSPLAELSLLAQWSPLKNNYREKGLIPYLFAGAGLSRLNVKRDWSALNAAYFTEAPAFWEGLAMDTTSRTPAVIPVLPVGAGLRYFFRPGMAISLESAYRLTATDRLDGFSRAANPDKHDHYITHSAGIIFRKPPKDRLKCPVMRY